MGLVLGALFIDLMKLIVPRSWREDIDHVERKHENRRAEWQEQFEDLDRALLESNRRAIATLRGER